MNADRLLKQVAQAAYPHVIAAYNDMLSEVPDYVEKDFKEEYLANIDGLYLYVYGDGNWIIDAPDYLQDHRNIVAAVSVYSYSNAETLWSELLHSTF